MGLHVENGIINAFSNPEEEPIVQKLLDLRHLSLVSPGRQEWLCVEKACTRYEREKSDNQNATFEVSLHGTLNSLPNVRCAPTGAIERKLK